MKEQLELKEIVGYLPYGLKSEILDYKSDYVGRQYDELIGIHQWSKKGDWCLLTGGGSKPSLDRVKPILFPISSLTEFREDLGFVPIDYIEELYYATNLGSQIERIIEDVRWINHADFIIIQYFYEWKIDIHNLI